MSNGTTDVGIIIDTELPEPGAMWVMTDEEMKMGGTDSPSGKLWGCRPEVRVSLERALRDHADIWAALAKV
jgi:hypothetical protein